ncbi:hypothetical protein ACQJBY_022337 [Aegilops geniculata]
MGGTGGDALPGVPRICVCQPRLALRPLCSAGPSPRHGCPWLVTRLLCGLLSHVQMHHRRVPCCPSDMINASTHRIHGLGYLMDLVLCLTFCCSVSERNPFASSLLAAATATLFAPLPFMEALLWSPTVAVDLG